MIPRIIATLRVVALVGILSLFVTACSFDSSTQPTPDQKWLMSGAILLARTMPTEGEIAPSAMLGFLPVESRQGKWLAIDLAKKSLQLMDDDRVLMTVTGEDLKGLSPGVYSVAHKQRNALWYAPDEYFSLRGLPLPPAGDKIRYRRGAFGNFVLYIDEDTPLHSGLAASSEVGGVQLDENDLSRIYYSLEVGAPVEVH